ncbi:MAG TPA: hypothetical protein VHV55_04875 [Pirellulales bacterium]|jgi:hypothetical protein|nr:hypothetical protein [Pirellulales bacterium]
MSKNKGIKKSVASNVATGTERPDEKAMTLVPVESYASDVPVIEYGPSGIATTEIGKPGLPKPQLEHEGIVDDESHAKTHEPTEVLAFTEGDKKEFGLLEQKVGSGKRQAFEALREIRQRQLWKLVKDEQGKQLYQTFDAYCEERWGHSRQWVTHGTNWLFITEEMELLGITDPPHLSVKAAQGLLIGRLEDAGGLRVMLQEAREDSVPLDQDHLREIVLRRADFNYWSKDGTEYVNKPAAKTYAEYKKDVAIVKPLGDSGSYSLWNDVLKAAGAPPPLGTALADALVAVAQQQRKMPSRDRLLANFTGVALEELVGRLMEVAKEIKEVEEKKTLLDDRRQELKALLQDGGIQKLKGEAKALEEQLVAVGAIKRRGRKDEPPQEDDGRGIPFPEQDEAEDGEQDAQVNEVLTNLTDALASLDLVLACDWSDVSGELNCILLALQGCEGKLTEIKAKVEKCLAEAEEPEAIPSGNH